MSEYNKCGECGNKAFTFYSEELLCCAHCGQFKNMPIIGLLRTRIMTLEEILDEYNNETD